MEGPTDVLSFECDGVDDDITGRRRWPSCPVYELGDIIDRARRRRASDAPSSATPFEQEVSACFMVHGLLHLCGYDHIVDDEAEVMEAREPSVEACSTAHGHERDAVPRCLREPAERLARGQPV